MNMQTHNSAQCLLIYSQLGKKKTIMIEWFKLPQHLETIYPLLSPVYEVHSELTRTSCLSLCILIPATNLYQILVLATNLKNRNIFKLWWQLGLHRFQLLPLDCIIILVSLDCIIILSSSVIPSHWEWFWMLWSFGNSPDFCGRWSVKQIWRRKKSCWSWVGLTKVKHVSLFATQPIRLTF